MKKLMVVLLLFCGCASSVVESDDTVILKMYFGDAAFVMESKGNDVKIITNRIGRHDFYVNRLDFMIDGKVYSIDRDIYFTEGTDSTYTYFMTSKHFIDKWSSSKMSEIKFGDYVNYQFDVRYDQYQMLREFNGMIQ
jgi:hypothetical protein